MIKKWHRWMLLAGIAGSLGLGAAAMAQSTTLQPFKGLFGSKTASDRKAADTGRMMEIQVELAWLSDRITFPYFLEAHVKGANLEVRGYVPTKAVREQALNLAKLNCPLPVIDVLKEHSSLAIRSIRRAPDQLKNSVQTALREAFPGQQLTVHCEADGTVQISGPVRSFEQKLAISQSLRRLHGCSKVANFTDIARGESAPAANLMLAPVSRPAMSAAPPASAAPAIGTVTSPPTAGDVDDQAAKANQEPKQDTPVIMSDRTPPPQPKSMGDQVAKVKQEPKQNTPVTMMAPPMVARTPPPQLTSRGEAPKLNQEQKQSTPVTTMAPSVPAQMPPPQPKSLQPETSAVKITTVDRPPVKITTVDVPAPALRSSTGPFKTPAQLKPGEPYECRGVIVVSTEDTLDIPTIPAWPAPSHVQAPIAPAPKITMGPSVSPPASAAQLKRRIETAITGVRNVSVTFTSKTDVRVECSIRPGEDSGALASQILALREFDPYKVDLRLQLPMPEK